MVPAKSSVSPDIEELLRKYEDCFPDKLPPGLPPHRGTGHVIPLEEGTTSISRGAYRHSPAEMKEMKAQVTELREQGFIRPSKSPFGSNVTFAGKKDGTKRMCIDFRPLNAKTKKNKGPIPRIDSILDQLQGAKIFSTIDLRQGYYQLRMEDEDVEKTAFRTPFGLYEFLVMPFGLTNAPASFQAAMNMVFEGYLDDFVQVYLDDILVYSKTKEEHLVHLEKVFQRLREHKFYGKLSKCVFGMSEVPYLGHVIGASGLKVDPAKTKAVEEWPAPTNIPELRAFLGFANYFRKFIPSYAQKTAPLNNLLRKKVQWDWTQQCQEAFAYVKKSLVQAPVLALPDPTKPFILKTDASGFGLGAVLLQDDQPIAYDGRGLTPAEKNYTVGEQELLAAVDALERFRVYLEGAQHPVTLITDHQPLVYLPTKQSLSPRQVRWSEYLSRFDLIWKHEPGATIVADPLSRRPLLLAAISSMSQVGPLGGLSETQEEDFAHAVQLAYDSDAWLKSHPDKVVAIDDYYWSKDGNLLYIPEHGNLRKQCLEFCHDQPYAGHMGKNKTEDLLQRHFWWPGWRVDVRMHVRQCDSCQRNKSSTQQPGGGLHPLPIPGRYWQSISMDWITHLPETAEGHTSILVVVDRLSKMTHFIPTKRTRPQPQMWQSCWSSMCSSCMESPRTSFPTEIPD